MGRTRLMAESGFSPLGLNLSLGQDGMVAILLNEAGVSNQLSGVNRKDRSSITPEEAILIQQFLDVEETNPLAANKLVLDGGRKVLNIIGSGTSHQAVVYQAEADDFKFHPKERYQNRPGSRWVIPVEEFGKALPVSESNNLIDAVVNDFNTTTLDMVTIGAMPLVGAYNTIKSIEPAVGILASKIRGGKKISLSTEFQALYEEIADQAVMEASPVLSKALLGISALAVAFGPIASTLKLTDLKLVGKAVHDNLRLGKGISFNGPNGGPEIPRWAGPISLFLLFIAACQRALESAPDPKVSIVTVTPAPTETKLPPVTLTSMPSSTPEIAITPSGGAEFRPGTVTDLQKLIDLNTFNASTCLDVSSSQYQDAKSKLQVQGANVDSLEKALRSNLKLGQSLKLLCQQEGWAFETFDAKGNLLWSWNLTQNRWADHPNAVLSTGWELRNIGEARSGHELKMTIIGGKPWAVEFRDKSAVRYFDTVSGQWLDFNWDKLPGSEKLINNNIKIGNITGDFSIKAGLNTQEGLGGGFNVKSPDGSKELRVTINRPKAVPLTKPTPELLVTLREGSKGSELFRGISLGAQIDGNDVLEVKFRHGTNQIVVLINGREVKTLQVAGLTSGGELLPGVIAGQDGKMIVAGLEVNVPNGGNNVKLVETIPPTATVAATLKPQFTPVPPTAVKPTQRPLLTPFTDGKYILIPVSQGPCVDASMLGVWLRAEGSQTESCFTGLERNPAMDASVEAIFNEAKKRGGGNYTATLIITRSIKSLTDGTDSFHYSASQFPYDQLGAKLAALPKGTKLVYSYKRPTGTTSASAITAYAELP